MLFLLEKNVNKTYLGMTILQYYWSWKFRHLERDTPDGWKIWREGYFLGKYLGRDLARHHLGYIETLSDLIKKEECQEA